MDVRIFVQEPDGTQAEWLAPTDMNLNLMEFLKGNDYPIEAICGGMALCATCHIEVLEGKVGALTDNEAAMLDTLFNTVPNSRLACQVRLKPEINNWLIRLKGEND